MFTCFAAVLFLTANCCYASSATNSSAITITRSTTTENPSSTESTTEKNIANTNTTTTKTALPGSTNTRNIATTTAIPASHATSYGILLTSPTSTTSQPTVSTEPLSNALTNLETSSSTGPPDVAGSPSNEENSNKETTTAKKEATTAGKTGSSNLIIILVLVIVIFAIIIVIGVVVWKTVQINRNGGLSFRGRGGDDEADDRETGVAKSIRIPIATFCAHVEKASTDSYLSLIIEYEDVKKSQAKQEQNAARIPQNVNKNRFRDIIPYDHSRVKLKNYDPKAGETDYINANYIGGYRTDHEYISAQGPLATTVNDFWLMVWEQNVRVMVMLTQCVELGKAKCEQYWPYDQTPTEYGKVTVKIISQKSSPNNAWVVTKMIISNEVS